MSQGVLQAIFEYQTAICELTGMDVSNASGYDGATVAADACFVAKAHTGRTRIVLAETLNPMARQVVKTYAPGFGMEVVEVPHDGGTIDPARFAEAADGAAVALFQHPNVFGCLEQAPELAEAANAGGAIPVAHVDLASLGILEAPGVYGCGMAIGEGQSVGNYQSYGGPHYGFMAAREEFIRRMPGRIVGETTDLEGERGFVLTLQTREQHIRREKATSNMTTNQTLLALGGLITLCWLGPEGLRELGESCMALTAYAQERVALPVAFERPVFKEVAFRTPIPAAEVVRRARALDVHPGYAIGRDYPGLDDVLLCAFTEKRAPADVERLAEVLEEVCA
jgi:glycine dehydrogenase subunit 1